MKTTRTNLVVTGLGIGVTALGATVLRGAVGNAALGFGAAHVVLGLLDMFRPTVKRGS